MFDSLARLIGYAANTIRKYRFAWGEAHQQVIDRLISRRR